MTEAGPGPLGQRPLSLLVAKRGISATGVEWPPLALAFVELGHDVSLARDGPVDLSPYDAVVLWGNPGWFPALRRVARSTPAGRRPPIAAYHLEPLPPPKASGLPRLSSLHAGELARILRRDPNATDVYTNAFALRRLAREGFVDLLFFGDAEQAEYAREQGLRCWHVPYAYHPSHGRLLGLPRTVDVLFLGDTAPRRRRRLLAFLRRQGIDVDVRGSWKDPSLWGEGRVRLLNQTKIVVHLQRYPGKVASMRMVLALANGALVVAEPCYRPEPFVPGVHYVEAPVRELPDAIRHYLAHDEERQRIVAEGHRFVTQEHTFARSAETMLGLLREHLASRARPGVAGAPGLASSTPRRWTWPR